jgi:hypothetical protein
MQNVSNWAQKIIQKDHYNNHYDDLLNFIDFYFFKRCNPDFIEHDIDEESIIFFIEFYGYEYIIVEKEIDENEVHYSIFYKEEEIISEYNTLGKFKEWFKSIN